MVFRQGTQRRETPPDSGVVRLAPLRRERCHGHQPDKVQPSSTPGEVDPLGKIAERYASFRRIVGDIHLNKDLDATAALGTGSAQTGDVVGITQAVNGDTKWCEFGELPSLNATDEMKP